MGDTQVNLTRARLSVDLAIKHVAGKNVGGTVVFIGSVRASSKGMRVKRMELEAAEDLAYEDIEHIVKRAHRRFEVLKVYVAHRLGKLQVGEMIVIIAVSAAHRKDAYGACRFIIDELKKTTPIWKKELGNGVQRWVGPEA